MMGIKVNAKNDWKKKIQKDFSPKWILQGDIVAPDKSLLPEPGYNNINYESILSDPYRTVSGEHPFYAKAIQNAVERIKHLKNPLVADFGCGDGRFVRTLIGGGIRRIVAMDIARDNLQRLADRLRQEPPMMDRVMLVEGDIADPPIQGRQFDLIIAVGVFLILNDGYANGVKTSASRLKPGGYLLTVDPTDYGAALYAIARHDLNELTKVVREKTKTVDIENPNAVRYSVRSAEQMTEAHRQAGQSLVDVSGIPIFPSLLFGGIKQMGGCDRREWPRLKALNDQLVEQYPNAWRAACVLSRCPDQKT